MTFDLIALALLVWAAVTFLVLAWWMDRHRNAPVIIPDRHPHCRVVQPRLPYDWEREL